MLYLRSRRSKLIGGVLSGLAIIVGSVWYVLKSEPSTKFSDNQNIDTIRQTYSDLYQASWRQDLGQGNVLMTATLLSPTMINLLDVDSNRSEAENQLYRAVDDTAGNQIVFFVTIDSVGAAQTDQSIRDSLTLTAKDTTFTLVSWKPLIYPSRVVNTNAPTVSQVGVATFTTNDTINWTTLTDVRLVSRNIGGIPERSFVWPEPSLLQLE